MPFEHLLRKRPFVCVLACRAAFGFAAAAAERFPPPDFTDHMLPPTIVPPPPGRVVSVSRPGRARAGPGAGFVSGDRAALAAGAVRARPSPRWLWLGFLAGGLHLSDRGDPERHAGPVRSAYAIPWTAARGVRPAAAVYALFRPHVLRRGLPLGGGAGISGRPSGQRPRLARSGAWACWPTFILGRA